jgi:hypothetical protein
MARNCPGRGAALCPQLAKADAASPRISLVQPTENCLGGRGRHKVDDHRGERAALGAGALRTSGSGAGELVISPIVPTE